MDQINTGLVQTSQEEPHSGDTVSKTGLAARLMALARETAPLMMDRRTSKELMDELYEEETGLPK